MPNIIQKMIGDKKRYRDQMARVDALPEDYRFVFKKIQGYMWSFAGGDGFDMLETQYGLIELFEAGVVEGKAVLDVTGEDVAGFSDELIRGNKLWTDSLRKKLNRAMRNQFNPEENPTQEEI